jgi:anti-sigma factor RsiW
MKDSEFIKLLNLYLDHEISPDEAVRLEAEVARDPARRQLYRQYCQMQKACVVLASQFEAAGTPPPAETLADRTAGRSQAGLWLGGLAAAAAFAVFVGFPRLHPAAAPAASAPAAALAQSLPADRAPAAAVFADFHPVFATRALAAAPTGQFAWIQQVQLEPIGSLEAQPLFLQAKPALELDNRPEAERAPGSAPEEKAAFQFQR